MHRAAFGVALALLLVVPFAEGRMEVAPREIFLDPGGSASFSIELFNTESSAARFAVELRAEGLEVAVDPPGAIIPAGGSAVLRGEVRDRVGTARNVTVDVVLYERNDVDPVEVQKVRVRVAPGGDPGEDARLVPLAVGLAAGAGAGALVGVLLSRRWHLLAAALYTRLRREAIAEHPSRARMLEVVRDAPGIMLADLQERTGLPNGPFEHHLKKLVEARRLVVVAEGRSRFVRLPGSMPLTEPGTTAGAIEALVRERGRVRATHIARALGVSRQIVHYHAHRLSKEGRIGVRLERGRLVLDAQR